jgi:3-oxoacyl-(acyl-carrier-protein) synthase
VVITDLGALTPVGLAAEETWQSLLAGRSGIRRVTSVDLSDCACQIGGEVKGFEPTTHLGYKQARRMARFRQLAVVAAQMALEDAGLGPEQVDHVNAHGAATPQGDGAETQAINLQHPDPACDLDCVPNTARPARVDVVLKNSFGIGSQNACLVLRRHPGD